MKKFFASLIIIIVLSIAATGTHAYLLPIYKISDADMAAPAEEVYARYQSEFRGTYDARTIAHLEEYARNKKIRLTVAEKEKIAGFDDLKNTVDFWKYAADLKSSLISLYGAAATAEIRNEADLMAKTIIQKIYNISQEYRVSFSALYQNVLINSGKKVKGFCYQYVDDIRKALSDHIWRYFSFRWGEAWAGTVRENNGLVITTQGGDFYDGIVIDVWRTAGKPYWTKVRGDRFPWKEADSVTLAK